MRLDWLPANHGRDEMGRPWIVVLGFVGPGETASCSLGKRTSRAREEHGTTVR
jgi:hypothetical protein